MTWHCCPSEAGADADADAAVASAAVASAAQDSWQALETASLNVAGKHHTWLGTLSVRGCHPVPGP